MSEQRLCPDCGAEKSYVSGDGLCQRCLLEIGLDDPAARTQVLVRCPSCHGAIEVQHDSALRDVGCPSCQARFSLIDEDADQHRTLSRFDLLEKIGAGGFGTVWKARDRELDRTVAVKIPHKGQLSPVEAEHVLREARAAAQLKHPNIVSVHEVGREDGSVYIVSDYIHGADLADWIVTEQATPKEAAGLCARIADALHHAHDMGVIHRDLKPSNVIIDASGEPHIMDFGLAKREAGEISMSVEGHVLGTPAYMSPEQAKGDSHRADRRSDVYSLGVVLFELLTGEKPFRGNVHMLLHQVIHDDAPPPHTLNSRIPRDLETICLKCLEKEPNKRYASAEELSAELRRFLRGEPILARPITVAARTWRWCARNPVVATLAATIAGLLLVLAVGGFVTAMVQTRLATKEARERARADDEAERVKLLYRNAEEHYRKAVELLERLVAVAPEDSPHRRELSQVYQGLAWFLATCPDPQLRDPAHAVELATLAVRRTQDDADCWRTLGVAQYRAGNWPECVKTLEKSLSLGPEKPVVAWLFLAMAHFELGDGDLARNWHEISMRWLSEHNADDEIRRFREEAASLLGLKKPFQR